jgi:uncharacterized protein (TIGR03437 family)
VANNSTPAKAGETIALFATGLGNTNPAFPSGQVITASANLATPATVTIGGLPATVSFAGLTSTGLYQVNVTVPAGLQAGDNVLTLSVGGFSSPGGAFVNVGQ